MSMLARAKCQATTSAMESRMEPRAGMSVAVLGSKLPMAEMPSVPLLNGWACPPTTICPSGEAREPERPSKTRPHLSTR
nr:hypothetical protein DA06_01430 [Georgenia sp. SUBG003]